MATVRAKYENGVLTPLEPLEIKDGAEVVVSVVDGAADGRSVEIRGEAIYEQSIRSRIEETAQGKIVVIDVESGDFEIDSDDATATARLLERCPDALTYAVRVGQPAAYRMGPRSIS